MVLVLVISLYTSRVVLEVLGIEDFGIYNVVCGFVAMFSFLNTSLTNGVQRFYNYYLGKEGDDGIVKVYNSAIRIHLVLAFAIIAITECVGLWYIHNKMVLPSDRLDEAICVFHFSVMSLGIVMMQIPYSAAVIAYEKMNYYAWVGIIDALLKLAIVFLLKVVLFDKLVLYGILTATITVINMLLYFSYSKRKFKSLRFLRESNNAINKEILIFSGWNLFGSFSSVAKEQGVNLILNFFFGPLVNAARGVAYQTSGAIQSFIVSVTSSVKPQLTQAYAQDNISRCLQIMYSSSKACYLIMLTLSIPVFFMSDYILSLWLGSNVPEFSSNFVKIVLLSTLVQSLSPVMSFVVHATGNMKKYQLVTSIISLLTIPSSIIILYFYKNEYVAFWLILLFQILTQIASAIIVRSLVGMSILKYTKDVIGPLFFITVISFGVSYLLLLKLPTSIVGFIALALISSMLIVAQTFVYGLNKKEKNAIIKMASYYRQKNYKTNDN